MTLVYFIHEEDTTVPLTTHFASWSRQVAGIALEVWVRHWRIHDFDAAASLLSSQK